MLLLGASLTAKLGTRFQPGFVVTDAVVIRQGILRDTEDAESVVSGAWRTSTSIDAFVGKSYLVKQATETAPGWEDSTVTFFLQVPVDGMYSLFVAGVGSDGRATAMPLTIKHAGGTTTMPIDQEAQGSSLAYAGTYRFSPVVRLQHRQACHSIEMSKSAVFLTQEACNHDREMFLNVMFCIGRAYLRIAFAYRLARLPSA